MATNNAREKVYTLPSAEEIMQRLQGTFDEPTVVQGLYPKIAQQGGTEKVSYGIANIFALAIYDFMQTGQLPILGPALNMWVPTWIEAIVDDKEVAEAAKAVWQEAQDAVRKPQPQSPTHEEQGRSVTEDDYNLYVAARKVADLVFEYAKGELWLEDRREEDANPYYNQTASGLFLEFYYGLPSKLWTPWGEWGFGGSGAGWWDDVHPQILTRLGALLHKPLKRTAMGEFGPVYALHQVDDLVLPEPAVRPHDEYLSYEEADAAWNALTARYVVANTNSKHN